MSDISTNNDTNNSTTSSSNVIQGLNSNIYEVNKNYQIFEKINLCKAIITQYQKWKENLIHLVDNYLENLEKYCRSLEDLIENVNNDCEWEMNFASFENINKLQSLIKDIDNEILKNEGNKQKSLKFLENIENNIKSKSNFIYKKLEEMEKMRLIQRNEDKMNSEYTSFSTLNYTKLLLGNKKGEVEIYDFSNNNKDSKRNQNEEKYKLLLKLEVLNNEVKYICELDEDLFTVSERKNIIKIIECKNNFTKYSIIQTIYLDDYDDVNIYSMISLPLFSSKEKKHFLCIATDRNIIIYCSNKIPKKLDISYNQNNEDLSFELFKTIELYTLTHCLIEANDKYLIAACPKEESIKFFDMTNDFNLVSNIEDINITSGSNIFAKFPNENKLMVACNNGFEIISIDEMKSIHKSLDLKYKILTIDILNENNIICCSSEGKNNKINQFEINKKNFELRTISEGSNKKNDEIWKFQKINGKILFINNQNIINYFI